MSGCRTLTEATDREIQRLQVDFLRVWKLLEREGMTKGRRRSFPTPAGVSKTEYAVAEAPMLRLVRGTVASLFPAPDFRVKKQVRVVEYRVDIWPNRQSEWRRMCGAALRGALGVAACAAREAVLDLTAYERGFIHANYFDTGYFRVAADGQAGGFSYGRRRRINTGRYADDANHDFRRAVEAMIAWSRRLKAAIAEMERATARMESELVAANNPSPPIPLPVPDRHQIEFAAAMATVAGRAI